MTDAETLRGAIVALKDGIGRGGLTYVAERLGMTPSALRKRLRSPTCGFDEPSLRAVLLIAGSKSQDFQGYQIIEAKKVGRYVIEIRDVDGEPTPCWRPAGK